MRKEDRRLISFAIKIKIVSASTAITASILNGNFISLITDASFSFSVMFSFSSDFIISGSNSAFNDVSEAFSPCLPRPADKNPGRYIH